MLTGAILAGGSSSRMGQEKGLALLGGVPLVERIAETLSEVCDEIVVSVAPGRKIIYSLGLGVPAKVVEDKVGGYGPVEGLVNSLSAASGDMVIISPCDTPFLCPDVCRLLVEAAEGRDGAVPVVSGYFEPLHGVYSRKKGLNAFRKTFEAGLRKPKDAYQHLDLAHVDEDGLRSADPELLSFFNVNTAEDLRKAEDLVRRATSRACGRHP